MGMMRMEVTTSDLFKQAIKEVIRQMFDSNEIEIKVRQDDGATITEIYIDGDYITSHYGY
jgi:hypothetical protein